MSIPHGHDWVETTENVELLEQVRLRLHVATLALEILPEGASLGQILALAEWLIGNAGKQIAVTTSSSPGQPLLFEDLIDDGDR